jgi:predicted RNase H-like HicB family nuclease
MTERRYLIVIEGGDDVNFSAYEPDLPGCVATGATLEECEREMRDAIAFHIDGLRESGQPVPEPSRVTATYVDVAA